MPMLEVPDDVIEAVKSIVTWSRSCNDPDGILADDIPVLAEWLVARGLLPADPKDRALLDLIEELGRVRYLHEVDTSGDCTLYIHLNRFLPALSDFLGRLREERFGDR